MKTCRMWGRKTVPNHNAPSAVFHCWDEGMVLVFSALFSPNVVWSLLAKAELLSHLSRVVEHPSGFLQTQSMELSGGLSIDTYLIKFFLKWTFAEVTIGDLLVYLGSSSVFQDCTLFCWWDLSRKRYPMESTYEFPHFCRPFFFSFSFFFVVSQAHNVS